MAQAEPERRNLGLRVAQAAPRARLGSEYRKLLAERLFGGEIAVKEGAVAVAREALRAADAKDPDGLFGRLRAAEAQLERREGELRSAAASSRTLDLGVAERERLARDALDHRSLCWSSRVVGLAVAVDSVRSLEHPLGALLALVDSEHCSTRSAVRPESRAICNPDCEDGQADLKVLVDRECSISQQRRGRRAAR